MQTIELKRRYVLLLIGLCLFSLAAAALEIRRSQPAGLAVITQAGQATEGPSDRTDQPAASGQPVKDKDRDLVPVYLVGAIQNPGIYQVERGSYLYELVAQAGGLLANAAREEINLALAITGNCHIRIPTQAELAENPASNEVLVHEISPDQQKVDVNSATLAELDQLPGIGPATAKAIIDFRTRNGPFKSPEDLMQVSGIKQSRLDAIRDLIRIS